MSCLGLGYLGKENARRHLGSTGVLQAINLVSPPTQNHLEPMPLQPGIRPQPGQVLICEFGPDPDSIVPPGIMVGPLAVKPEIFKERPSIVLNSTIGMTIIVPLSTVAPRNPTNIHYKIIAGKYPFLDQQNDSWLKGDIIATVSNDRLDRPFVASRRSNVKIDKADFLAVRAAVLNGIGLGKLVTHLNPPQPATPTPTVPAPTGAPGGV